MEKEFGVGELTLEHIRSAYKKLKSYLYYDNTMLFLKLKLAKFENKLKNNEDKEFRKILNIIEDEKELLEYLNKISYNIIPKSIRTVDEESLDNEIFTNLTDNNVNIEKINIFIDCPIELHIISVLWIMFVGKNLDSELSNNIYGYRLEKIDNNFSLNSYKLFYKYYEKYSSFRDNAVKEALYLHKQNKNVTFVNLDIKEFFYNIKIDFKTIKSNNYIKNKLTDILEKIHLKYQEVLRKENVKNNNDTEIENYLPIGLLSSFVLANYALKEFDDYINDSLQPQFYSRYVDDILLVFQRKIVNKHELFNLLKKFSNDKITFKYDKDVINFKCLNNNFSIQNSKVKIFFFDKNYSISVLRKFKKQIEENRSIIKDLPESNSVFERIEDNTVSLIYNGTFNKVSSIKEMKLDKLSLSINLSHIIKILLLTYNDEEKKDLIKKTNEQIMTIFSNTNLLELNSYWEKLFIYLLISGSYKELKKIKLNILSEIKKITSIKFQTNIEKIKNFYIDYLNISICLAFSTNYEFLIEKQDIVVESLIEDKTIKKNIEYIANANMFKHNFNVLPILNFFNISKNFIINKYDNKIFVKINQLELKKNEFKIKFSPRFIRYDELLLLDRLKGLYDNSYNNLNDVFKQYIDFNFFNNKERSNYYKRNKLYPKNEGEYVTIGNKEYSKLKIALASIKIDINNSERSMDNNPNLTLKRLDEIHKILNLSRKYNVKVIVFPEIAIPIYLLNDLMSFAKNNDIAIIGGLEHFNIDKKVFNYSFVILPFKDDNYRNIFIDFNLKKYFSPEEIKIIKCKFYTPYENNKEEKMNLYKYYDIKFSIFNCFELTSLNLRAKVFKKVDVVFALEYNKDVNYFSNLVTSFSRDLHAYVVQVNTINYGDNRIIQPSKSEILDIVKIKGGEDTNIVTGTINIDKLKKFQNKSYTCQKEDNSFKPTPAGFHK